MKPDDKAIIEVQEPNSETPLNTDPLCSTTTGLITYLTTGEFVTKQQCKKATRVSGQRWKLDNNNKLENKEGVWKSDDLWIFKPKDDDLIYIENTSKAKVLGATSDGEVILEDFEEGKAHQVWKKRELDAEDYYLTLETFGVPKVLTAVSESSLEIKDRIGWKQHPYTLSIYQSLIDILQEDENEALEYAEEFETMYEQIYEPLEKHILAKPEEDRSSSSFIEKLTNFKQSMALAHRIVAIISLRSIADTAEISLRSIANRNSIGTAFDILSELFTRQLSDGSDELKPVTQEDFMKKLAETWKGDDKPEELEPSKVNKFLRGERSMRKSIKIFKKHGLSMMALNTVEPGMKRKSLL